MTPEDNPFYHHQTSDIPWGPFIQGRRYDRVVYLNDVYFCAEDVILLLMHDDAHMATAVDTLGMPPEANATRLWMYDWWVTRDIDGQTMKVPYPPTRVNQSIKW